MKKKTKQLLISTVGAAGLLLASAQAVSANTTAEVHQGDTVWGFAQKNNVSIQSIEALNKISSQTHIIFPGQKLQIPTQQKAAKAAANTQTGTYVVKAGDTLWDIARAHQMSVSQLRKLNNLAANSDLIQIGQVLKVAANTQTVVKNTSPVQKSAPAASTAASQAHANSTASSSSTKQAVASSSAGSSSVAKQANAAVSSSASSSSVQSSSSSQAAVSSSASAQNNSAASSSAASSSSVQSSSSSQAAVSSSASAQNNSAASSSAAAQTSSAAGSSSASASSTYALASSNSQTQTSYKTQTSYTQQTPSVTSPKAASYSQTQTSSVASSQTSQSQTSTTTQTTTSNAAVVAIAKKYLGTPYVWGGNSPKGFDCSGFTQYVYNQIGKQIGRTTVAQESAGTQIPVSQAQAGDLLFWGSKGSSYHVAISTGGTGYIASPQPGQNVKYGSTTYYKPSFAVHVN